MYSQAQNKATQKYIKEHLDQLSFRVPKGERDKYKALAERADMSLAELLRRAVEEYAASHGLD